jgi:hypothetical protein
MRMTLTRVFLITVIALAAWIAPAKGSVIFTYDFPGSPGSGLAANQTNGQPWLGTFSDFTRTVGLTQMPGAPANNAYGTESWNQTGSIDTTQHEGFSITAAAGCHLNLTSLSFDLQLKPSGPLNFEVGLFLNGSSTAYATLDLTPTATLTTYTFDFTDLTDADNVTSAEFRFFGWNAVATGGGIVVDNVITNGVILPEANPTYFVALPVLLALVNMFRRRRRPSRSNPVAQASAVGQRI